MFDVLHCLVAGVTLDLIDEEPCEGVEEIFVGRGLDGKAVKLGIGDSEVFEEEIKGVQDSVDDSDPLGECGSTLVRFMVTGFMRTEPCP